MRTKAEAIEFLQYKPPCDTERPLYALVTDAFIELVKVIYDTMPDGPGKTVAIRKIADARMSVNSAIANRGQ
jgi:hypothetical protein